MESHWRLFRCRAFELSPKTEAGEVAIFGDSISHGGGSVSYSPTDWEFSYASYLHFPTINLSQSGDTSTMAAERFEKDVLPFKPSYVIVLVGSNSLRAGVPSWEVIGDLQSIKKQALENGIKPVFLTIPPLNPRNIKAAFDQDTTDDWRLSIAEVNDYIDTQVHIDIVPGMADDDGELKTELALDGLHLDPPGKELMAEAIIMPGMILRPFLTALGIGLYLNDCKKITPCRSVAGVLLFRIIIFWP